jgi:Penicillin-insensitive murein endopeptidase
MGWRFDEVWLDTDVLWFREQPQPSGAAAVALPPGATDLLDALFAPVPTGLDESRRRRLAAQAARRRRLATRTVPAVALVLGSATMLPIAALRHRAAGQDLGPLLEDPPSLTFRADEFGFQLPEKAAPPVRAPETEGVRVEWRHARSLGLQYAGSLVDGTQLPVEGPDWVTWNPNTDSSPNLPWRLYGNEHTIRRVLAVVTAFRAAHPDAPRVVVGDISLRHGGRMDQHVSHQNGLDVDVYYPRLDRHLRAPIATSQIDHELAQDLLDRFVAAGARMVFVGFSTGLHGPSGVVVPYPNHENHMHVRFRAPLQ